MSEVQPQFWYDPDRNLEFRFSTDEDIPAELTERTVTDLDGMQGVAVTTEADDIRVSVDVGRGFDPVFKRQDEAPITALVQNINRLSPFSPQDNIDRVMGIEWPGRGGLDVAVYAQQQRWNNVFEPAENRKVAKRVLRSMAEPFAEDPPGKMEILANGVAALPYRFFFSADESRHFQMSLYSVEERETEVFEHSGTVGWRAFTLETLGNCACLGVDPGLSSMYNPGHHGKRLYELKPHNIENIRATFSLMLGLGAIAFEAARLESDEDVLANAEWREPRVYPMRHYRP